MIARKVQEYFPNIAAGAYSYGSLTVDGVGSLHIGKFCSFSQKVALLLEGHRTDWFTTYPFPTFHEEWPSAETFVGHPHRGKGIYIGNDVWVGWGATITDGAYIADGAVISANSFVTSYVKPYSVVGGNPAEFLFTRFPKEVVDLLLRLKWWDLPLSAIKEILPTLCSSNVERLQELVERFRP